MSKISFVYFDVGGVAIKDFSDSPKWGELREYLGLSEEQFKQFEQIYNDQIKDICCGKIPTDTVVKTFLSKTRIPLPAHFSLQRYFLDNFEKNELIWPIMSETKKKVRIGLLTDMFIGLFDGIKEKGLLPPTPWDELVDSSVIGFKKPMPEIYEIAAQKAAVPPEEILFVDNRQYNLDGALIAGWQTFLYDSSNYAKSSQELAKFLTENL